MQIFKKILLIIFTFIFFVLVQLLLEITFGYGYLSNSEAALRWIGRKENLDTLISANLVISAFLLIPSIWLPLMFYRK